eukprot:TRINITY_DN3669_c0_g1_i1.p1 TRINITY_DN3669_c0_g1~~TRINITY_DN3669_c0_g1_i1.p1  ORF type:complete len:477 (+),score=23.90 TRINITY_DN3669_c0_g1_i1:70-1500(+)
MCRRTSSKCIALIVFLSLLGTTRSTCLDRGSFMRSSAAEFHYGDHSSVTSFWYSTENESIYAHTCSVLTRSCQGPSLVLEATGLGSGVGALQASTLPSGKIALSALFTESANQFLVVILCSDSLCTNASQAGHNKWHSVTNRIAIPISSNTDGTTYPGQNVFNMLIGSDGFPTFVAALNSTTTNKILVARCKDERCEQNLDVFLIPNLEGYFISSISAVINDRGYPDIYYYRSINSTCTNGEWALDIIRCNNDACSSSSEATIATQLNLVCPSNPLFRRVLRAVSDNSGNTRVTFSTMNGATYFAVCSQSACTTTSSHVNDLNVHWGTTGRTNFQVLMSDDSFGQDLRLCDDAECDRDTSPHGKLTESIFGSVGYSITGVSSGNQEFLVVMKDCRSENPEDGSVFSTIHFLNITDLSSSWPNASDPLITCEACSSGESTTATSDSTSANGEDSDDSSAVSLRITSFFVAALLAFVI